MGSFVHCCFIQREGKLDSCVYCPPKKFGQTFLFYGKFNGYWPFTCHVGPDWPAVIAVYLMIIGINAILLSVMSTVLGWPIVLLGLFTCTLLLIAYSCVALSNPGIIERSEYSLQINELMPDTEQQLSGAASISTSVNTNTVQKIHCGSCDMERPMTASHCHFCGVCVNKLDHHCPWCGKCIGEKNIRNFYRFLFLLQYQCYFLIGSFIYFILAGYVVTYLPTGPHT